MVERQWPRRFGLRPLKTRCDHPPRYENDDRVNDRQNETRAFAGLISPDRLGQRCQSS